MILRGPNDSLEPPDILVYMYHVTCGMQGAVKQTLLIKVG